HPGGPGRTRPGLAGLGPARGRLVRCGARGDPHPDVKPAQRKPQLCRRTMDQDTGGSWMRTWSPSTLAVVFVCGATEVSSAALAARYGSASDKVRASVTCS